LREGAGRRPISEKLKAAIIGKRLEGG